jgi:hypothetical protein
MPEHLRRVPVQRPLRHQPAPPRDRPPAGCGELIAWTARQARNLMMVLGEQAHKTTFMIRHGGPDFAAAIDGGPFRRRCGAG